MIQSNLWTSVIATLLLVLLGGWSAGIAEDRVIKLDDKTTLELMLQNRKATVVMRKEGGWVCTIERTDSDEHLDPLTLDSASFRDGKLVSLFDYIDQKVKILNNESLIILLGDNKEENAQTVSDLRLARPIKPYWVVLGRLDPSARWGVEVFDVRLSSELKGMNVK